MVNTEIPRNKDIILNVEGVKVRFLSAVHNVAQHVAQHAFL